MNDEWIDQLLAEPVDLEPRDGFRHELRERLADEFNSTAISQTRVNNKRPRRWMLGAVAASAALLAGGVLVLRDDDQTVIDIDAANTPSDTNDTPAPSDDSSEVDPTAISLDDWIDMTWSGVIDPSVAFVDRSNLPDGWSVSDERGRLIVYPTDMTGYLYEAVVTIDDDVEFAVTLTRDPVMSDPCFIPLAGHEGSIGDLTGETPGEAVCGSKADGDGLAIAPIGDAAAATTSALQVADTLTFVPTDDFPHLDLVVADGGEEPAEVDFAGTLAGVRWAVAFDRSKIDLYVAGTSSSGLGLSSTETASPIEGGLHGVPGYGAIAYGLVVVDAATVTVTTTDGRTANLPLAPKDGRILFAVPIPESVDVDTLTFLATDGSTLAIVDVPDIPVGYEAGMLSLMPRS